MEPLPGFQARRLADWQFLENLPPCAAPLIAARFIAGLVAIFMSVVLAVSALRAVRMGGFGNVATFVKGSDAESMLKLVYWLPATTDEVCEKAHNAHALELKSPEGQCGRTGRRTRQSQQSLANGLALSLVWASAVIGLGVAAQAAAAAWLPACAPRRAPTRVAPRLGINTALRARARNVLRRGGHAQHAL